jgi:hypothetical protein
VNDDLTKYEVTRSVGEGADLAVDGVAGHGASFRQPAGLCVVGHSIFVADVAAPGIRLITYIPPLLAYLRAERNLADAYSIHGSSKPQDTLTVAEALALLESVDSFLKEHVRAIHNVLGSERTLNGTEGAVTDIQVKAIAALVESFRLLLWVEETKFCLKSATTDPDEHFISVVLRFLGSRWNHCADPRACACADASAVSANLWTSCAGDVQALDKF